MVTQASAAAPTPVLGGHVWVASGVSIAVLLLATFALFGFSAKVLRGLLLGADKRASTSKFQATAWTYAILFALVTLLVGHLLYADFDHGWSKFLEDGLNSDYLWLLGIPSVGLVGAKAITQSKVQANPEAKPTKTDGDNGLLARTRELASNDDDLDPQPALGDLQYLVFNAVAVAYFLSAFLGHVELGLPSLPDTLIALTGVSAASYLSAKAVKSAAPPVIISVRPLRVVLGGAVTELEVSGTGFLGPTGSGETPGVTLGGATLDVADGATAEHLSAIVPTAAIAAQRGLDPGKLGLVVYTPGGQPSAPTTVEVLEQPKA
jgi:hypothetical protein